MSPNISCSICIERHRNGQKIYSARPVRLLPDDWCFFLVYYYDYYSAIEARQSDRHLVALMDQNGTQTRLRLRRCYRRCGRLIYRQLNLSAESLIN
jgi:hypothetical protein